MLRRTRLGSRSCKGHRPSSRCSLRQLVKKSDVAQSLSSAARCEAVATSSSPLVGHATASNINDIFKFGLEKISVTPEASENPSTTTTALRKPWGLSDTPAGHQGDILGWSTTLAETNYAAAGVVPFAYKEDEGELYVLVSIQRSDSSCVYTFLGGKVDRVDQHDARRTAAREVHEETHRLLCERAVLSALTASTPACSRACTCSDAATGHGGSGAAGAAGAEVASRATGAGPGPGSQKTAAAAAAATRRRGRPSKQPQTVAGGTAAAAGGGSGGAGAAAAEALGPGSAPHEHFPSGRYIAFALHLPDAWQLPAECAAKVKAGDKHPAADKVLGLEWLSFARLTELRSRWLLWPPGAAAPVRAHHFLASLLRTKRQGVGVYEWLRRMRAHLRRWHGLPEDAPEAAAVGRSARRGAAGAASDAEDAEGSEAGAEEVEGRRTPDVSAFLQEFLRMPDVTVSAQLVTHSQSHTQSQPASQPQWSPQSQPLSVPKPSEQAHSTPHPEMLTPSSSQRAQTGGQPQAQPRPQQSAGLQSGVRRTLSVQDALVNYEVANMHVESSSAPSGGQGYLAGGPTDAGTRNKRVADSTMEGASPGVSGGSGAPTGDAAGADMRGDGRAYPPTAADTRADQVSPGGSSGRTGAGGLTTASTGAGANVMTAAARADAPMAVPHLGSVAPAPAGSLTGFAGSSPAGRAARGALPPPVPLPLTRVQRAAAPSVTDAVARLPSAKDWGASGRGGGGDGTGGRGAGSARDVMYRPPPPMLPLPSLSIDQARTHSRLPPTPMASPVQPSPASAPVASTNTNATAQAGMAASAAAGASAAVTRDSPLPGSQAIAAAAAAASAAAVPAAGVGAAVANVDPVTPPTLPTADATVSTARTREEKAGALPRQSLSPPPTTLPEHEPRASPSLPLPPLAADGEPTPSPGSRLHPSPLIGTASRSHAAQPQERDASFTLWRMDGNIETIAAPTLRPPCTVLWSHPQPAVQGQVPKRQPAAEGAEHSSRGADSHAPPLLLPPSQQRQQEHGEQPRREEQHGTQLHADAAVEAARCIEAAGRVGPLLWCLDGTPAPAVDSTGEPLQPTVLRPQHSGVQPATSGASGQQVRAASSVPPSGASPCEQSLHSQPESPAAESAAEAASGARAQVTVAVPLGAASQPTPPPVPPPPPLQSGGQSPLILLVPTEGAGGALELGAAAAAKSLPLLVAPIREEQQQRQEHPLQDRTASQQEAVRSFTLWRMQGGHESHGLVDKLLFAPSVLRPPLPRTPMQSLQRTPQQSMPRQPQLQQHPTPQQPMPQDSALPPAASQRRQPDGIISNSSGAAVSACGH